MEERGEKKERKENGGNVREYSGMALLAGFAE